MATERAPLEPSSKVDIKDFTFRRSDFFKKLRSTQLIIPQHPE
jgi:hypothetical protein